MSEIPFFGTAKNSISLNRLKPITEHAAAEVSEGGIFTPKNREKPSVLGKLSVAKTQEKTPTAPGTAMKKKEDIQL